MAERIPNLTIENARIVFRNFAGKEKQFNPAGQRNFSVIIDDEKWAQHLHNDGWNVKPLKQRNPGDPIEYALPVAVRFDNFPPKIVMITSQGQTQMDENTVGMLDIAELRNVDLILSPSKWEVRGAFGIKAYLKTMYVTIEENELDKKYGTYPTYATGVTCSADEDVPF